MTWLVVEHNVSIVIHEKGDIQENIVHIANFN